MTQFCLSFQLAQPRVLYGSRVRRPPDTWSQAVCGSSVSTQVICLLMAPSCGIGSGLNVLAQPAASRRMAAARRRMSTTAAHYEVTAVPFNPPLGESIPAHDVRAGVI